MKTDKKSIELIRLLKKSISPKITTETLKTGMVIDFEETETECKWYVSVGKGIAGIVAKGTADTIKNATYAAHDAAIDIYNQDMSVLIEARFEQGMEVFEQAEQGDK